MRVACLNNWITRVVSLKQFRWSNILLHWYASILLNYINSSLKWLAQVKRKVDIIIGMCSRCFGGNSRVEEFCFSLVRNCRLLIVFLRQKGSKLLRGNRRFVCHFVVIFMSEMIVFSSLFSSKKKWRINKIPTGIRIIELPIHYLMHRPLRYQSFTTDIIKWFYISNKLYFGVQGQIGFAN